MASRSRASEYCSDALYEFERLFVTKNKIKDVHTILVVFKLLIARRATYLQENHPVAEERRGKMYARKNSKVEREEKSRDKVNESHEESGLLIKTYGGSREERSIYSDEKAVGPPPSNFRRTAGAMINSLPVRFAKKPVTASHGPQVSAKSN